MSAWLELTDLSGISRLLNARGSAAAAIQEMGTPLDRFQTLTYGSPGQGPDRRVADCATLGVFCDMAGFTTHISVSTAVGVGYGWWVHSQYELPWTTAAVAGGLCSLAGMLPDLDSDSGIPARETICFTAAIVPMLMMNRFQHLGLTYEQLILAGAPIYIFIRFGLGTLLKEFTVHRGMFHSIPAMVLSGLLTFLISDSTSTTVRVLKGVAVALGYLSHLVLDELWSVEVTTAGSRLKSSSGTALKFFGKNAAANAMCWGLLILVGFGSFQDLGLAGINPGTAPQLASPPLPVRPPTQPLVGQPPLLTQPPVDDAFEPLPEWPRPNRPIPAITERGVITPRQPLDQARRSPYEIPR